MSKILCVDDDEGLVQVLSDMISFCGFDAVTATSGEECFRRLDDGLMPDLILLDIMMYPMDGWQTLSRLREDPRFCMVPVLMLTGKYPTMTEVSTYGMLFEGYLMKPFALQHLNVSIKGILARVKVRESIIERALGAGMDKGALCEFRRLFSVGEVLNQFETIMTDGSFDRGILSHLTDRLEDLERQLGEHGIELSEAIPDPPIIATERDTVALEGRAGE